MYDFHIITNITSLSGEGVKYYLLDLFFQEVPPSPPLLAEYIWQIWGGIPPIFHFFSTLPSHRGKKAAAGVLAWPGRPGDSTGAFGVGRGGSRSHTQFSLTSKIPIISFTAQINDLFTNHKRCIQLGRGRDTTNA